MSKQANKRKPGEPRGKGERTGNPARKARVRELLDAGKTPAEIKAIVCVEYECSPRTVQRELSEEYAKDELEEADQRPARRAEKRARLMRMLSMASGEIGTPTTIDVALVPADPSGPADGEKRIERMVVDVVKVDHNAVAKYEDQLSKLDGLDAPSKVEHKVDIDTSIAAEIEQMVTRLAGIATEGDDDEGGE